MKILETIFMCLCGAVAGMAASLSSIAIDAQGNIWRTGQNLSVALTDNAFQKTQASSVCGTQQLSPFVPPTSVYCSHAFVTKQDPNGNIVYATYLGGSSEDGGIAITTDPQGNAYVTGFTYSPDFPVTAGVVQQHNAGPLTPRTVLEALGPFGPVAIVPGGDVFVARFAADGTLLYSTLLGGSGSDVPVSIAQDEAGSAYVAGTTESGDFPVTSDALPHQPQSFNFFVRLDPRAASLVYATYSDPTIQSFDVDSLGNAFLTGVSQPSAGIAGPYVTEVDTATGQVQFTTFLPDIDPKFAGAGAAIASNAGGGAIVGVSPAPMPSPLLVTAPPVYPLGPSFLLTLAAGGASVAAETDIDNTQFDQVIVDGNGDAYAFGHGNGTLPLAAVMPLLSAPCSVAGGEFVIELDSTGAVAAATYLRQGSAEAVAVTAPGQLSVYRAASQNTVSADLTSSPTMNFACLVNLASGWVGPGIAPGEIFTLFGSNIGPATAAVASLDTSGRFPTSLSGVQVLIGGTPAPLLTVESTSIEGVVPFGYLPPVATIEVKYQDATGPALDAPSSDNPGIFTINGQAAVLNQDGIVNTPSNPARLGSIISIYATGTGNLQESIPDGEIVPLPPPYYALVDTPQVTVAGVNGQVLWAGAAPGLIAGGTQINVQLPATLPAGTNLAAVPVVVISPGVFSQPAPISVTQ